MDAMRPAGPKRRAPRVVTPVWETAVREESALPWVQCASMSPFILTHYAEIEGFVVHRWLYDHNETASSNHYCIYHAECKPEEGMEPLIAAAQAAGLQVTAFKHHCTTHGDFYRCFSDIDLGELLPMLAALQKLAWNSVVKALNWDEGRSN